jgi:hypothetical protein
MAEVKTAVLFPGKQNHWILALPGATGPMPDREQAAVTWFTIFFGEPHEDVRVTGSQVGEPEKIRANFIQRDIGAELPSDTTYVAIAFDYLGDEDAIDWPDDGNAQLWAVIQGAPTIHLKTPIEELDDILDNTIEDIDEDTAELGENVKEAADSVSSIVIFGGMVAAAAWLYGVIKAK